MQYANLLQLYRKRANYTQRELAEKIGGGVNQTQVSNWETGISLPTLEQRKKIAKMFKESESKIFGDKL